MDLEKFDLHGAVVTLVWAVVAGVLELAELVGAVLHRPSVRWQRHACLVVACLMVAGRAGSVTRVRSGLRWRSGWPRTLVLASPLVIAITSSHAAESSPVGVQAAQTVAVVGIVEGAAVLVRQASRYGLIEGVRLAGDDIVEASPGSHVQIEFTDGVMLSLADGARVMLQPRWAQRRGSAAGPRAYVFDGWVKLSVPAGVPTPAESATLWLNAAPNLAPASAKADRAATLVLRLTPPDVAVFVEAGSFRMTDRQDAQRRSNLAVNDFVWRQGSPRLQQANKPSVDFVAALPPLFRDVLPARAGKFADRLVSARPLGNIAYTDVAAWLRGEPALRASLVERWRGRAADPPFRTALQTNLAQHPEWELVVYPERAIDRAASRAAQASR